MSGFSRFFNFEFKLNQIAKAVLGFAVASLASLPRVIRAEDPAPTRNNIESTSPIYLGIGAGIGGLALSCFVIILCREWCKTRATRTPAGHEMVAAGAPSDATALEFGLLAADQQAQRDACLGNRQYIPHI